MTKEFKDAMFENESIQKSAIMIRNELNGLEDVTADTFIEGLDIQEDDIKKALFELGYYDKLKDQRQNTNTAIVMGMRRAYQVGRQDGAETYKEGLIKGATEGLLITGLLYGYIQYRKPINKFVKNNVNKLKNKFKKKDSVKDIKITRYDDVEDL